MTAALPPERLIVAGGGLAGCLLALALAQRRPELPLLLIEGAERLGGNHIWSFFGSDVAAADWWLVEPLISASWANHEVRFPAHRRLLPQSYHSIRSDRLDSVVRERLGPERLRLGAELRAVEPDGVELADGERIAGTVIDARGAAGTGGLELGWQKFVGMEFAFETPHGIERPVIMDATVEQIDGYRFVYLLPFSPTQLLVEDTYYSDTPDLDVRIVRQRIAAHVAELGLPEARVEREETGVLPVVIGGDVEGLLAQGGAAAKVGMRGGFFHPTTGYSLPDAVRMAVRIANLRHPDPAALRKVTDGQARRLWRSRGFYRMLNRMLFHAARPHERYRVLERFYRLPAGLVGRFYAGRSNSYDKLRTLIGKPPIPIPTAVRALLTRRRVV